VYLYGYPSCFDRNTDNKTLKKKTTEARAHIATTVNTTSMQQAILRQFYTKSDAKNTLL